MAGLLSWFSRTKRLNRPMLARTYLRGTGIEIGALHRPLRVPPGVAVRYLDRLPRDELARQYPTLAGRDLAPVDIVDDGERLTAVADNSQDFVIANHFLEHCQDPIGTLLHFFRVLRGGGILFLTVPDKRYTFDRVRPVTPIGHLRADHQFGPLQSQRAHLEEWVRLVQGETDPAAIAQQVDELKATGFSIHYHVWTQREFMELLLELRGRVAFEIELFLKRAYEMIAILRKGEPSADKVARDSVECDVEALRNVK